MKLFGPVADQKAAEKEYSDLDIQVCLVKPVFNPLGLTRLLAANVGPSRKATVRRQRHCGGKKLDNFSFSSAQLFADHLHQRT